MLKKYMTYAKLNVFPKIHDADLDKISHVYAELRRESSVSSFESSIELHIGTLFCM
jgi:DNA replicative helicase MCM subunit Mcm2 (Cdc46/Mcm family)